MALGSLRRDEGGADRLVRLLRRGPRTRRRAGLEGPAPGSPHRRRPAHLRLPARALLAGLAGRRSRTPSAVVATDEVEARFWEAVEREDLEELAAELDVAEGSAAELGAVLPVLSSWRRQRRERSTLDRWRYQVNWKPLPGGRRLWASVLSGRWLVVVPEERGCAPLGGRCAVRRWRGPAPRLSNCALLSGGVDA